MELQTVLLLQAVKEITNEITIMKKEMTSMRRDMGVKQVELKAELRL